MREFCTTLVVRHETYPGRVFDLTIIGLIFYSLLVLSLESLPPELLPDQLFFLLFLWQLPFFQYAEIVITLLFLTEMGLRIWLRGGLYLRGWFVVDLMAVLPTLSILVFGLDLDSLRSIRALRILKIFSILSEGRYGLAIRRVGRALKKAKEELVMFFSLALIIIFASAAIVYGVESAAGTEGFESIFHSLWWSVATLTTVGYGDFSPETPLGKLFTGVIIFAGLGVVGAPAAIISGALVDARADREHEDSEPEPVVPTHRGASLIALLIVGLVVGATLLLAYIDPVPGFRSKF